MAWKITQLQVDYTQNRVAISINEQAAGNDWLAVNVNFPRSDAGQTGGDAEQRLKAQAKQILLDAANSL